MSLAKRQKKEKKILQAKEVADIKIAEQRALFKEREAHAEKVREEFERIKSLDRDRMKTQAENKAMQMVQIFKDS